jgi:hypothetical protein
MQATTNQGMHHDDADSRDGGGGRRVRSYFTPQCLRDLVPGRCNFPKIYLVHQQSSKDCQGYYCGGTPTASCSRRWDGPQCARSEADAVLSVVKWLWDNHARHGNPGLDGQRRPTEEEVREAVRALHAAPAAAAAAPAAAAAAAAVLPLGRGRAVARGGRGGRGGARGARGRGPP